MASEVKEIHLVYPLVYRMVTLILTLPVSTASTDSVDSQ